MASWLSPRNWRGETSRQELERRVKALEASVQSAHDRINEMDERLGVHCNADMRNTRVHMHDRPS
jgi:hypothetical protein